MDTVSLEPKTGCRWPFAWRRATFAIGAGVVWGFVPAALADAPKEAVVLYYDAPLGCPDRQQFAQAVCGRTPRVVVVVGDGQPATTRIRIKITQEEFGYRGTLTVQGTAENPSSRGFTAASCDGVASALALVTALTVDPLAVTTPIAPPPNATPLAPPAEPKAALPLAPGQPLPVAHPLPSPASIAPRSPTHSRLRLQWNAGATLAVLWGPASQPLVALSPHVEFERRTRQGLSPRLGLAPVIAQSGVLGPAERLAVFRLTGARTSICPLRWVSPHWEGGMCAAAELGWLGVQGQNIPQHNETGRFWSALGFGSEVGWRSPNGFIRLEAALRAPLVRHRFIVEPKAFVVHAQPLVAGSLALTLGMRFP